MDFSFFFSLIIWLVHLLQDTVELEIIETWINLVQDRVHIHHEEDVEIVTAVDRHLQEEEEVDRRIAADEMNEVNTVEVHHREDEDIAKALLHQEEGVIVAIVEVPHEGQEDTVLVAEVRAYRIFFFLAFVHKNISL